MDKRIDELPEVCQGCPEVEYCTTTPDMWGCEEPKKEIENER